ncbi:LysE family translocator protein [Streptomyces himastatinicus ATCC 53653]|uniref:LysE family translocator protein n=1 Tax=Streptomyces himastatinicus ATCC 53653 TaxID=457427 RepID=D9WM07_9ACTN|nr:LysE family translocator [Streptomyces himastatinicus]EFL23747.1 LysE family translocator protein [Streptomyces himastatinicus ATCC 53653]
MLTSALAFAGVAALINVTPGLDTLLVLRTSVSHGRNAGLAASLGILAGCLVWGFATAVGLTALLTASRVAYDTLRVAGAAYLVWLGASALWRSRRAAASETETEQAAPAPRGRWAAFRAGVGTNLLNPKAGVFYMSLIPQFTPDGASVFTATLVFTAIDIVELALWYWVVSGAASALSERIRRPAFRRRMEQASGVAFFGFAANLLAEGGRKTA